MSYKDKVIKKIENYQHWTTLMSLTTPEGSLEFHEVMDEVLALLKKQQQKKAELLKKFDKEIEWAEQARVDSACEGENAWVEHYAWQKSYYEHAKSIVENTL